MNEIETQKKIDEISGQFNSLGIFSDDSSVREQGIAALKPEFQEDARKFLNRMKKTNLLLTVVMSDLQRVSMESRNNFDDQFRRRTAIRAFAAAVDGSVFCLKELTHAAAGLKKIQLNEEEDKFLLDEKIDGKHYLGFKENFKRTFQLFAQIMSFPYATNFDRHEFSALCETFKLRHQLMHPKSFLTFCVTDDQAKRAGEAAEWLHTEIQKLLNSCNEKINSNIEKELKQSN